MSVSVCLFVCLSVCPLAYHINDMSKLRQIFSACQLRLWLDHPLTTMQYIMHSGFVKDVIFVHNRVYVARLRGCILKVIHQGAVREAKT